MIQDEQVAGFIVAKSAWTRPTFEVLDAEGTPIFKVTSPSEAVVGSFKDSKFKILSAIEPDVNCHKNFLRNVSKQWNTILKLFIKVCLGMVTKMWSGAAREFFSDIDSFGLNVPEDLDHVWKGVLLIVLFVIDYVFYEDHGGPWLDDDYDFVDI